MTASEYRSLLGVRTGPLRLLRAHELRRTEDHPLLRQDERAGAHLALGHLGEAEVEHLREVPEPSLLAEEEVLRLHVAVDDPRLVRLFQCAADLDEDGQGAGDREGTFGADRLIEVLPLQELHDDVERAVLELTVEEDLGRVGVRQVAHRPGLAAEARDEILPVDQLGVEDLHPDHAVHRRLRRLVDGAHAPRADLLEDLELSVQDLTSDERIERHPVSDTTICPWFRSRERVPRTPACGAHAIARTSRTRASMPLAASEIDFASM